jgi:ABC-2 type transport system permease protein
VSGASVLIPIVVVTLRGLLSRRRFILMLLLAVIPLVIALLIRLAGRPPDPERLTATILRDLILGTILPLIALVFGTAAIGSELEDGTAIYLLAKPIGRWWIIAAKLVAAAGLTIALTVPVAIVSGLLVSGDQGGGASLTIAFAGGILVAAVLYSAIFIALSVLTGRALIIGLVYTLLWEGLLAGLFDGTRVLSVRQYAIGIAGVLDPTGGINPGLNSVTALGLSALALAVAFAFATRRLGVYQVRSSD